MGQSYSYPPPNALAVCYVMEPGCLPKKVQFDQQYLALPPALQQYPSITRMDWERLVRAVAAESADFKDEQTWVPAGGVICAVTFAMQFLFTALVMVDGPLPLVIPGILALYGIIWYVKNFNQKVDARIHQLMPEHAAKFEQAGLLLQYQTAYTNVCKPKHARLWRAVTIINQMAMQQGAMMGPGGPMMAPAGAPVMMPGQPVAAYGQPMQYGQPMPYAQPGVAQGAYAQPAGYAPPVGAPVAQYVPFSYTPPGDASAGSAQPAHPTDPTYQPPGHPPMSQATVSAPQSFGAEPALPNTSQEAPAVSVTQGSSSSEPSKPGAFQVVGFS